MKKLYLLFLLIIIGLLPAQKVKIINNESTLFKIEYKKEPIEFIVFNTKLNKKMPVFLWCQGSLPYPLYVNSKNGLWFIGGGITNFDLENITKHYYLVVLSMPETPVIAEESQINDSYWYFGDSKDAQMPTDKFQRADNLENYTARAMKVLKFLKKQPWVDQSKLIIAGHSQGSKVATKVAINDKDVTKLGLFSANPFGRIDQNIRAARKDAEQHKISWVEADKEIETEYQNYRDANNDKILKQNIGLLAWKSFSDPLIDDWLKVAKPIYLAYGTADIASDLCDLVPLYFIRAHKNNLTYKRYLNLEHNFFEVNEDLTPNHDKPHWKEVMNEFIKWTLKP